MSLNDQLHTSQNNTALDMTEITAQTVGFKLVKV